MSDKKPIPFLKRIRYALETVAAYAVYYIFKIIPLDIASAFSGWLIRKIGPHLAIHQVAVRNLELAMPEKTAAEKAKILDGMWDNLGRVIAEYPHLYHIRRNIELVDSLDAAGKEAGRPAIFFGAHLGNWEIVPIAAKFKNLPVHVVYRKPNNPGVDGLLRRARKAGAEGQIEKGGAGARAILSTLKKNIAVGMLIDQKLSEGMPVPFFGRDAMTADAVAQFALRLSCNIYPCRVERLAGCRFRVTVLPPLDVHRTGDLQADARRIMTEANKIIEGWIRERPEQWLWIHRRWPESR